MPLDAATAAASAVAVAQRKTARGLVDPNAGIRRMFAYPSVMTSPPVAPVRGVANAGTTITGGGYDVAWNDVSGRIRYLGAVPVLVTVGGTNYGRVESWTGQTVPGQAVWAAEFVADSRYLEVVLNAPAACKYKLWVDGQPATAAAYSGPGPTSSRFRDLIDFGTRAIRHIEIELTDQAYFWGVGVEHDGAVWKSDSPIGGTYAILGDSFTFGSGAVTDNMGSFPTYLGRRLGWRNLYRCAQGGTGYLNASTGGKRDFLSRVADLPTGADLVLVQGSTNDSGLDSPAGTLATRATAIYAAIRARCPNAKLVVALPFEIGQVGQAAITALADAIRPIATAQADLVIEPQAELWFTGTGKVGSTTGTGAADVYRYSDNLHPTDLGSAALGFMLAQRIAGALPL